ncbi:MAG: MBL fold metallo-hydrolase [Candidatus Lokiarchaeota archaeon]|nr:MBL fold metallo-hydrolase [Candidatus Lokiarchaeota archaeon]
MEIVDRVYSIDSFGFDSNCYIIGKNEITIIDTGASERNAKRIIDTIKNLGLDPNNITKIIITHKHPDHSGGLYGLLKMLESNSITVYVHESALRYYTKVENIKGLKEGDILNLDDLEFRVVHTPGHTQDGICLYNEKNKILISGDTVFSHGNIGRTDLAGGSMKTLIRSIEKLVDLDVEYLLPGHMDFVMDGNRHVARSLKFAKSCSGFY